MTETEGVGVLAAVKEALPARLRQRLKAIHMDQKLHEGHCTIRIFMVSKTAEDPIPIIRSAEEL